MAQRGVYADEEEGSRESTCKRGLLAVTSSGLY